MKLQDFEVEFVSPTAVPQVVPTTDLVPKTQELSDEDLLFYSVNEPTPKK